ncbi:MAG: hypothetical protein K0R65_1796 [Crocinitomicaceae bacterium]|nr:hypothetical protein [Crocinitomicaceae bacterium]
MLALVAVVMVSCSKDAKINRRIDGDWRVISIGGFSVDPDIIIMSFDKEKRKTGDGSLSWTNEFGTEVSAFSYSVQDQKITLTLDGETEVLNVTKYEKDDLEFSDSDNDLWILERK